MAKRRHLALSMKNLEESAKLYEDAFDIRRVRQSNVAIMPSDGVVSLALLHLWSNDNTPDKRGPDYIGMHHMGFLVDDVPGANEAVEAAGGKYHGKNSERRCGARVGTQVPGSERHGNRRHVARTCGLAVAGAERFLIRPNAFEEQRFC